MPVEETATGNLICELIFKLLAAHPYIITIAMEQSPSWEANSYSAGQEIPQIL
jgi:hypothetical protein